MAKVRLVDLQLNPQPKSWLRCDDCKTAFVLRQAMVMSTTKDPTTGRKKTMLQMEWTWQRDCKHKKAKVTVGGITVIKPKKRKAPRR